MFWQSVEELEAETDRRRTESKEDRMRRKGLEALRNIEEATRKKDGKEVVDKNKGMTDKVTITAKLLDNGQKYEKNKERHTTKTKFTDGQH